MATSASSMASIKRPRSAIGTSAHAACAARARSTAAPMARSSATGRSA
jgi:hypothetical protein